ncbi:hypothetical protein [Cellulomonas fimi]|uniref:STAS domain-containing protein n=1 Tax=Cellulomonas fimi (strain ATCC 484 / DSM 20113 / JCM 1341 / CCUG 24087 / LMG 16345 / NBRC 15513 / NCIMB 8980 / NCTC 7547 / NRS-133) TaxID=590998 RepID=F4H261_CELFA|nr:hypothetical protein [Cellulomonas fimi]AEE46358.1 hypothetical protein Celf_2230 [Cellulomonas fimi ATCC 484]NNH07158.1 hypothetical protein [Cellulomonas fimi]VEH32669.1 Uncharacterised protein [Cellulomonas fimi]
MVSGPAGMHALVRLDLDDALVEVSGPVGRTDVPALLDVVARAQRIEPDLVVDVSAADVTAEALADLGAAARAGAGPCRPFALRT